MDGCLGARARTCSGSDDLPNDPQRGIPLVPFSAQAASMQKFVADEIDKRWLLLSARLTEDILQRVSVAVSKHNEEERGGLAKEATLKLSQRLETSEQRFKDIVEQRFKDIVQSDQLQATGAQVQVDERLAIIQDRLKQIENSLEEKVKTNGMNGIASENLLVKDDGLVQTDQRLATFQEWCEKIEKSLRACEDKIEPQVYDQKADVALSKAFAEPAKEGVSKEVMDMEQRLQTMEASMLELSQREDPPESGENADCAKAGNAVMFHSFVMETSLCYEFQESTWDSTVFIHLGFVNIADSFLILLAFLLSLFIQLVWIVVVGRDMTQNPLESSNVMQLTNWRQFVGHDYKYYEAFSDTSLVARVCSGTLALSESGIQSNLFGGLDAFLGDPADNATFMGVTIGFNAISGTVLNMTCIFIWTITCQSELIQTLQFLIAVIKLTSTDHAFESQLSHDADGEKFELKHISLGRVVFLIVFCVIPRLFILVSLYACGVAFLVYSTDLPDLLLNALALAFVIDVDNQIYAVFAPRSARDTLGRMEPVPIHEISQHSILYRFGDVGSFLSFGIYLVGTFMIYTGLVEDLETNMKAAWTAICGGHQNFVYTQNTASQLVYYLETSAVTSTPDELLYLQQAVNRLSNVNGTHPSGDTFDYTLKLLHLDDMNTIYLSQDSQDAANLYTCVDLLMSSSTDSSQVAMQNMLKFMIGVEATACTDISSYCVSQSTSDLAKVAARSICPKSCGCMSGQVGAFDLVGCPQACYSIRQKKITQVIQSNTVNHSRCLDYNVVGDIEFGNFFWDFERYLNDNNFLSRAFMKLGHLGYNTSLGLEELALQNGCALVKSWRYNHLAPNPCLTTDTYLATVASFCPTSCHYDETPCSTSHLPSPPASTANESSAPSRLSTNHLSNRKR